MRRIILGSIVLMAAVAMATQSPFPMWLQKYIDQPGTRNGKDINRIARVTYDVAVHGGSVADHALGVYLPKNAIIKNVYYYVATAWSSAGGTVALYCEDANNVISAIDMRTKGQGAVHTGAANGVVSTYKLGIAASCQITATVATAAQSTGKLNAWVEYVTSD